MNVFEKLGKTKKVIILLKFVEPNMNALIDWVENLV
jgi:hypothetical protein